MIDSVLMDADELEEKLIKAFERLRVVGDCWDLQLRLTMKNGIVLTRRVLYVLWGQGPPLGSYQMDTTCDNRMFCVNPRHLIRGDREGRSAITSRGYRKLIILGNRTNCLNMLKSIMRLTEHGNSRAG